MRLPVRLRRRPAGPGQPDLPDLDRLLPRRARRAPQVPGPAGSGQPDLPRDARRTAAADAGRRTSDRDGPAPRRRQPAPGPRQLAADHRRRRRGDRRPHLRLRRQRPARVRARAPRRPPPGRAGDRLGDRGRAGRRRARGRVHGRRGVPGRRGRRSRPLRVDGQRRLGADTGRQRLAVGGCRDRYRGGVAAGGGTGRPACHRLAASGTVVRSDGSAAEDAVRRRLGRPAGVLLLAPLVAAEHTVGVLAVVAADDWPGRTRSGC